MGIEIRNAVIESVQLTTADRGLLTAWLMLDYGGTGQGFGGYALYLPLSFSHHRLSDGFAGHFIYRCLQIAGVDDWSKLPGRTIRARIDGGRVCAIGHIVRDEWFEPGADFKAGRATGATHD